MHSSSPMYGTAAWPDDGRLGFPARATSSRASAGLLGRRDGRVTRDEALAQAPVICEATDLPVSADLEKGFGNAPEFVAEAERR
jgi:2-methylisocitrate lyase-like PEP mutase family enzyme